VNLVEPKSPKLIRILRTVGSAALGVRASKHHLEDGGDKLSPFALLVTALIFMAFFVGGLVTLAMHFAGK